MAAGYDESLMTLVLAIIADDEATALRILDTTPELVTATQPTGADEFFDAITHYIYGGDTALHMAAAAYRSNLVTALVERGADAGARNRRGAQPLHYASDGSPSSAGWDPESQRATIDTLVRAGGDVNALDKSGVAPLHRAVRTRCAAAVAALLAAGADRNLPNRSGSTPLDLATRTTGRGGSGEPAAKTQQEEIIELLSS